MNERYFITRSNRTLYHAEINGHAKCNRRIVPRAEPHSGQPFVLNTREELPPWAAFCGQCGKKASYTAPDSQLTQSIDVDTLVHAALTGRRSWDPDDVVDFIGTMIHHLIAEGMDVTCDGRSYRPLSPQSWGRLVQERELLADEDSPREHSS